MNESLGVKFFEWRYLLLTLLCNENIWTTEKKNFRVQIYICMNFLQVNNMYNLLDRAAYKLRFWYNKGRGGGLTSRINKTSNRII